jgi:hypothetical protein
MSNKDQVKEIVENAVDYLLSDPRVLESIKFRETSYAEVVTYFSDKLFLELTQHSDNIKHTQIT